MELIMLAVSLCSIYTLVVLAALVWDVVKQPWYIRHKNKFECDCANIIKSDQGWKGALVSALIFFVGLYGIWVMLPEFIDTGASTEELDQAYEDGYRYALRDFIDCPYCGEGFPERLAYETYTGDTICPECIRDDFNDLLNGEILRCYDCGSFYDPSDSYGLGLCFDCAEHVVTECYYCRQPTLLWPGHDGHTLCAECMGEVYNDWSVSYAINRWLGE